MRHKRKLRGRKKAALVMREFAKGKLHSGGSGKVVTNPAQAKAIAMSEAKLQDVQHGDFTPRKR